MKYSKQIRKIMEINLINGLDGCDCWVIAKYQLAVENTKCFYHCVFSQWIINDFVIFFPLMTDRRSTWTLWKLTKNRWTMTTLLKHEHTKKQKPIYDQCSRNQQFEHYVHKIENMKLNRIHSHNYWFDSTAQQIVVYRYIISVNIHFQLWFKVR